MYPVNLKAIVPELEKRCAKLDTARKILFPLAMLIIPAVPAMIVLHKYAYCAQLCRIVNAVKMQEKVPLISVFGYAPNAAEAAQKLIDTGNLSDYRLVAGVMLVRNDIELGEEEARAEYAKFFNPMAATTAGMKVDDVPQSVKDAVAEQFDTAVADVRITGKEKDAAEAAATGVSFCPSCGKRLSGEGANFCPCCGTKL